MTYRVITKRQFADRLYFLLSLTGMSKNSLAARIRVQPSYISAYLRPTEENADKAMEPTAIHRVAAGLGFKASIFFVEDYIHCVHNDFLIDADSASLAEVTQ